MEAGYALRLPAETREFWQVGEMPKGETCRNYIKVLLKKWRNSAERRNLPKPIINAETAETLPKL